MKSFYPAVFMLGALAACSETIIDTSNAIDAPPFDPSNPPVLNGSITRESADRFTFSDNGTAFDITLSGTFNGQPGLFQGQNIVASYQSDTALALAGQYEGENFGVLNSARVISPVSTATYQGRIVAITENGSTNRPVDLRLNTLPVGNPLDATLVGSAGDISINASVDDGTISGNVLQGARSAGIDGALTSSSELVGTFDSTGFSGLFYGTR